MISSSINIKPGYVFLIQSITIKVENVTTDGPYGGPQAYKLMNVATTATKVRKKDVFFIGLSLNVSRSSIIIN